MYIFLVACVRQLLQRLVSNDDRADAVGRADKHSAVHATTLGVVCGFSAATLTASLMMGAPPATVTGEYVARN